MLTIPQITPVRIKTEFIEREFIDPGSMSYYFPAEVGPRVVYLDEQYDYPPQVGNVPDVERNRQTRIWDRFDAAGGVRFMDRQVEEEAGRALRDIQQEFHEEFRHHRSAEYFERVFSRLFGETMNVVIISTGVRPFDRYNYHDIGYLRP